MYPRERVRARHIQRVLIWLWAFVLITSSQKIEWDNGVVKLLQTFRANQDSDSQPVLNQLYRWGYDIEDVTAVAPYAICAFVRCLCPAYQNRKEGGFDSVCCQAQQNGRRLSEEWPTEKSHARTAQVAQESFSLWKRNGTYKASVPPESIGRRLQPNVLNPMPGQGTPGNNLPGQGTPGDNLPGEGTPKDDQRAPGADANWPSTQAYYYMMCFNTLSTGFADADAVLVKMLGSSGGDKVAIHSVTHQKLTRLNDGAVMLTYQLHADWAPVVGATPQPNVEYEVAQPGAQSPEQIVWVAATPSPVGSNSPICQGLDGWWLVTFTSQTTGNDVAQCVPPYALRKKMFTSSNIYVKTFYPFNNNDGLPFAPDGGNIKLRKLQVAELSHKRLNGNEYALSLEVLPMIPVTSQYRTSLPNGTCLLNKDVFLDGSAGKAGYRVLLIGIFGNQNARITRTLELRITTAKYKYIRSLTSHYNPGAKRFNSLQFVSKLSQNVDATTGNHVMVSYFQGFPTTSSDQPIVISDGGQQVEYIDYRRDQNTQTYLTIKPDAISGTYNTSTGTVTQGRQAGVMSVQKCAFIFGRKSSVGLLPQANPDNCGNQFAVSEMGACICSQNNQNFPSGELPIGEWSLYELDGQAPFYVTDQVGNWQDRSSSYIIETKTIFVDGGTNQQTTSEVQSGAWTSSGSFIHLAVVRFAGTEHSHGLWATRLTMNADGSLTWGTATQWRQYGDNVISIKGVRGGAIATNHALVIADVYRHSPTSIADLVTFGVEIDGNGAIQFGPALVLRGIESGFQEGITFWLSCALHDLRILNEQDAVALVTDTASCSGSNSGRTAVGFDVVSYDKTSRRVSRNWWLTKPKHWDNIPPSGTKMFAGMNLMCALDALPTGAANSVRVYNEYDRFGAAWMFMVASANQNRVAKVEVAICMPGQRATLTATIEGDPQTFRRTAETQWKLYGDEEREISGICNPRYTGNWPIKCTGATSSEALTRILDPTDSAVVFSKLVFRALTEYTDQGLTTLDACRKKRCYNRGDTYGYTGDGRFNVVDGQLDSSLTSTRDDRKCWYDGLAHIADSCNAFCQNGWAAKYSSLTWARHSKLWTGKSMNPDTIVKSTCSEDYANWFFSGCEPVIPMRMNELRPDLMQFQFGGNAIQTSLTASMQIATNRGVPWAVSAAAIQSKNIGIATMSFNSVVQNEEVMEKTFISAYTLPDLPAMDHIASKLQVTKCAASFRGQGNSMGHNTSKPKIVVLGDSLVLQFCKHMACYEDRVQQDMDPNVTGSDVSWPLDGINWGSGSNTSSNTTLPECPAYLMAELIHVDVVTAQAWHCASQYPTPNGSNKERCEAGNNLSDGYTYMYNEGATMTIPGTCGFAGCECCQRRQGSIGLQYLGSQVLLDPQEEDSPAGSAPMQFDAVALAPIGSTQQAVLVYTKTIKSGITACPAAAAAAKERRLQPGQQMQQGQQILQGQQQQGQQQQQQQQQQGQQQQLGQQQQPGLQMQQGNQGGVQPAPQWAESCEDYRNSTPRQTGACSTIEYELYVTKVSVEDGGLQSSILSVSDSVRLGVFPTLPLVHTTAMPSGIVLISVTGSLNSTNNTDTRSYVRVIGFNPSTNEVQNLDYGKDPVFARETVQSVCRTVPNCCTVPGEGIPKNGTVEADITFPQSLFSSGATDMAILSAGEAAEFRGLSFSVYLGANESTAFEPIKTDEGLDGMCLDLYRSVITPSYTDETFDECLARCRMDGNCNAFTHYEGNTDSCCWLLGQRPSKAINMTNGDSDPRVLTGWTCYVKTDVKRSLQLRAKVDGAGGTLVVANITNIFANAHIGQVHRVGVRLQRGVPVAFVYDGREYSNTELLAKQGQAQNGPAIRTVCIGVGTSWNSLNAFPGTIEKFRIWNSIHRTAVETEYGFRYAEAEIYDGFTKDLPVAFGSNNKAKYHSGSIFALNANLAAFTVIQEGYGSVSEGEAWIVPAEWRISLIELTQSSNSFSLSWKSVHWNTTGGYQAWNNSFPSLSHIFGNTVKFSGTEMASVDVGDEVSLVLGAKVLETALVRASADKWSILICYRVVSDESLAPTAYKFNRLDVTQDSGALNGFRLNVTNQALLSPLVYQSYNLKAEASNILMYSRFGRRFPAAGGLIASPILALAGNRSVVMLAADSAVSDPLDPSSMTHSVAFKFEALLMESCFFGSPECYLWKPLDPMHTPDKNMNSGIVDFNLSVYGPSSDGTSEAVGYEVCTADTWSNLTDTRDCARCGVQGSGVTSLFKIPASTSHRSVLTYSYNNRPMKPWIIVCNYLGTSGIRGEAVAAKVLDAATHACTLGTDCTVNIGGAGQLSQIRLVSYTNPESQPSAITDPWAMDLDLAFENARQSPSPSPSIFGRYCLNQDAVFLEPVDIEPVYKSTNTDDPGSFELRIGVQSPGYYGICLGAVSGAEQFPCNPPVCPQIPEAQANFVRDTNDQTGKYYIGTRDRPNRQGMAIIFPKGAYNENRQAGRYDSQMLVGLLEVDGPAYSHFSGIPISNINNPTGYPQPQPTTAVRGQALSFSLPGMHRPSNPQAVVMIQESDCPLPVGSNKLPTGGQGSPVFGWTTSIQTDSFSTINTVYGVSTVTQGAGPYLYRMPLEGVQPAAFWICWCTLNAGQEWSDAKTSDKCTEPRDFVVRAGQIDLIGPYTPTTEHICFRGRSCTFEEYGRMFTNQDKLHVCENKSFGTPYAWDQVSTFTISAKNLSITSFTMIKGTMKSPIIAAPAQYQLCWRSGRQVNMGVVENLAGSPVSLLRVVGPVLPAVSTDVHVCKLGAVCNFVLRLVNPSRTLPQWLLFKVLRGELTAATWLEAYANTPSKSPKTPSSIMLKGPVQSSELEDPELFNPRACSLKGPASSIVGSLTTAAMVGVSDASGNIQATYSWAPNERFISARPGYRSAICWCVGLDACEQQQDFSAWSGILVLHGPQQGAIYGTTCAVGSQCQVSLTGYELSTAEDFVMIKSSTGGCSGSGVQGFYARVCRVGDTSNGCYLKDTAIANGGDPSSFSCPAGCVTGRSDFPATKSTRAGQENDLIFKWSGDENRAQPGNYSVCYCGEGQAGCSSASQFQFFVEALVVTAAPLPTAYVCVTGPQHDCVIDVVGRQGATFNSTEIVLKRGKRQTSEYLACRGQPPAIGFEAAAATGLRGMVNHALYPGKTRFHIGVIGAHGISDDGEDTIEICWCGNKASEEACNYHFVFIGHLIIEGPKSSNAFICVLGQWCNLPGLNGEAVKHPSAPPESYTSNILSNQQPLAGVNIRDGDFLLIAQSGYCGSSGQPANWNPTPSSHELLKGRSAPYRNYRFTWIQQHLSLDNSLIMDLSPEEYDLCWCRGVCDVYTHYLNSPAGKLSLSGPALGQKQECVRGRDCKMVINGVGLRQGDIVETLPFLGTCGEDNLGKAAGLTYNSNLEVTFGLNIMQSNGKLMNPFTHSPGIYKICWCQPMYVGKTCTAVVEAGSVLVKGPLRLNEIHMMGESFQLDGVNGIGLSTTRDWVMLLKQCGQTMGGPPPLSASVQRGTSGESELFDFGIISQSRILAGTYEKCWCQVDSLDSDGNSVCGSKATNYDTPFGEFVVFCKEGMETDVPPNDGICIDCRRGRWLQYPGPLRRCAPCPPNSITQRTGSTLLANCTCYPGYVWDAIEDACQACATAAPDHFCHGYNIDAGGNWQRASATACPRNSQINRVELTPSSIVYCLCLRGYAPDPVNVTADLSSFECNQCPIGTYKAVRDNSQCVSCQGILNGSVTPRVGTTTHLDCRCPAGTYALRTTSGGVPNCEICPQGYYCDGTHDLRQYWDGKTRCQDGKPGADDGLLGSTTNGTGAMSAVDCICDVGFSCNTHDGSKCTQCLACQEGRYKEYIGNVPWGWSGDTSECLQTCPSNMTSVAGAVAITNCICIAGYRRTDPADPNSPCVYADAAAVQEGETTFQAPAVTGELMLAGMRDTNDLATKTDTGREFVTQLKRQLGITTDSQCQSTVIDDILQLECIDMSVTIDYSTATQPSRRLQSSTSPGGLLVQWTIRTSESSAKLAAQNFEPNELTSSLRENLLFTNLNEITQTTSPFYTRVNQSCPTNRAKPPGAPFKSVLESCVCQTGFYLNPDDRLCAKCPIGRYKSVASDDQCNSCDPRPNVADFMRRTGIDATSGDPILGVTSMSGCFCKPGYYGICAFGQLLLESANQSNFDFGDLCCGLCPKGQYCADDLTDDPLDCLEGSLTRFNGSTGEGDCECLPGFGRQNGEQLPCVPCPPRTYKSTHRDEVCADCPQEQMMSFLGSTSTSDCYCIQDYYFKDAKCVACQGERGLACPGGFVNQSRQEALQHRMPLAVEGFYLSGNARALRCATNKAGDDPICLGGRTEEIWNGPCLKDCLCKEGMDGFLCQNCKPGWTRDTYNDICELCPEVSDLYFRLVLVFVSSIISAAAYHALTIMAIRAGSGTKSLHSTLLRLWQSWAISMSVLKTFDFTQIDMFAWGAEAIRMREIADNNATSTNASAGGDSFADSVNTLVPWPSWFQDVSRLVYGFDSISVSVGTPTTTAECLAEYIFGVENAGGWKYIMTVIYHVAYPMVVLFVMIVIDVIMIWVVYPPLERNHFFQPKDPKELKKWLFGLAKPELLDAMDSEELGTDEAHREQVEKLCEYLFSKCSVASVADMKLLLQNPREGLAALADLFPSVERKHSVFTQEDVSLARMAMLLLSRKAITKDLNVVLSTDESRKNNLFDTANELHIDDSETLLEGVEFWQAVVECGKYYKIDEWLQLLKGPRTIVGTLIQSGIHPVKLQIAFCFPLFQEKAKSEKMMPPRLAAQVWASMHDVLYELGPDRVLTVLSQENALDNLLRNVEFKIPSSGSLLVVAFHQEQLQGYFREHYAEHSSEMWNALMDTMLYREVLDQDTEAEDVPPKVRMRAEELNAIFNKGDLYKVLYTIARRAGTGPGGYFLAMMRQTRIQSYMEQMPGISAARAQSGEEVQASTRKILHFCYITDFDEVDQLLSEQSVASLVEAYTRADKDGLGKERKDRSMASSSGARALPPAGVGVLTAGIGAGMIAGGGGGASLGGLGGLAGAVMGVTEMLGSQTSTDYPVFNLFRANPSARQFFQDFAPLFWIALYSMWYQTTRSLLLMIHCEANVEEDADGSPSSKLRWAKQMNLECYTGDHLTITLICFVGLGVWSLGLLVVLGRLIWKHKKEITSNPQVIRVYSYFVTGYSPDRCYWDIFVKKVDNLLTIVFTFSSFAPDVKAKILIYAALSSVFLTIHNLYMPFDDRKNQLCDRVENFGLSVRFLVFGMIEVLLIFTQMLNLTVATILAVITLLSCTYFLFTLWVNIACEFSADFSSEKPGGEMVSEEKMETLKKLSGEEEDKGCFSRVMGSISKCVGRCFQCCCLPVRHFLLVTAKNLANVQQHLEDEVLCFMPAPNFARRVQPRIISVNGLFKRFKQHVKIWYFYQGDQTQREYLVRVFGNFVGHLMCQLEEERIEMGNGLLSRFLTISSAFKTVSKVHTTADLKPGDIAELVKSHLYECAKAAQDFITLDDSDKDPWGTVDIGQSFEDQEEAAKKEAEKLQALRLTGEDLNDALMFLQRLSSEQLNSLLTAAADVNTGIAQEMGSVRPTAKSSKLTGLNTPAHGEDRLALTNDSATDFVADAWKRKAMEMMGLEGVSGGNGNGNAETQAIVPVEETNILPSDAQANKPVVSLRTKV